MSTAPSAERPLRADARRNRERVLAVAARMRERFGVDVQALHGDDGIICRLPDLEFEDGHEAIGRDILDLVRLDSGEVHDTVVREIGASMMDMGQRFRMVANEVDVVPTDAPAVSASYRMNRRS